MNNTINLLFMGKDLQWENQERKQIISPTQHRKISNILELVSLTNEAYYNEDSH